MTEVDSLATWAAMAIAARHRIAGSGNPTRVMVQWGHCSQAVGADVLYRRLSEMLAERPDVAVIASGCDGACFAATQVVVERADGTTRFFDLVGANDDLSAIVTAADGEGHEGQGAPVPGFGGILCATAHRADGKCWRHQSTFAGRIPDRQAATKVGATALSMTPEAVIQLVLDAGLLGRGGAYFPAARKWQAARRVNADHRHLVVNAEEGEPGLFKDRHLMEGNPHRIIEGALIAAYAAGADRVVIYVNAEAHLSAERLSAAVADADAADLFGPKGPGQRIRMHCRSASRRRRLRLRRGDHVTEHYRRAAARAAAPSPIPHRRGTVRRARQ